MKVDGIELVEGDRVLVNYQSIHTIRKFPHVKVGPVSGINITRNVIFEDGPTMNDLLNKLRNKQKKLSSVINPRKRARLEDEIWRLEEKLLMKI